MFPLAVASRNFSLVRCVLASVSKHTDVKEFLEDNRSNNILKAMNSAVKVVDESVSIQLIRLALEFNLDIPEDYSPSDDTTVYRDSVIKNALEHRKYSFVAAFKSADVQQTVWIWFTKQTPVARESVPQAIRNIHDQYVWKQYHAWEGYRSLALVFRRKINSDMFVFRHICSYVYMRELDLEQVERADYFRKHAEYCSDCEGYDCICNYGGYYSS